MLTTNQLFKKGREYKRRKGTRARGLQQHPQRLAVCYKVLTMKPKKPNSANRKIAKVRLVCNKKKKINMLHTRTNS
jgi:small subunit ribosomal protein S12